MNKQSLGLSLFLVSVFWGPSFLNAAGPVDNFFAPGNSASYGLQYEPDHDGQPRVLQQKVRGSLIAAQMESDVWTVTAGGSLMDLSQTVTIPQTGVVFPESLGSVETGVNYLKKLGERRQWGASVSVGSASDQLFHSIYETEFQVTGHYLFPSRGYNAWLLLMQYSNNRTFLNNIPLPGFAYMWNKPEKGLQLIAGFPFLALTYKPQPDWSAVLSVLGFTNNSAELARRIKGPVWTYVAYQRNPEQWMRAGRNDHSNRLIYDEKRTVLGFRSEIGKLAIDLSGGRTFDRRLFESQDATHTGAPRVNLKNGWIISVVLSTRWGS
jgi:hypothetical protein